MAGTNSREIRQRIKSIESTMQITKAMELVASSKLRKAKERAERGRPYFNILYETMTAIASGNTDFQSAYTRSGTKKSPLYLVIAGDRGLAGGYNANIFRLAAREMDGKTAKVIAIGGRAADHFKHIQADVVESFRSVGEQLNSTAARTIAQCALTCFLSGKADEVYVIFSQFVSPLVQTPCVLKMLPLSLEAEPHQKSPLTLYDPSPEEVFDRIIPAYAVGMVLGAVTESYASEQGARRTAMEAANENAKEMIDALKLDYNRARQSAITQEINEIISGANASRS